MAYISQEEKKQLAPKINKVLKKYSCKGSISIKHHSKLQVTIKSSKIDFCELVYKILLNRSYYRNEAIKPDYVDINHHSISDDLRRLGHEEEAIFFEELTAAMRGDNWYDRSDLITDYFDTAYYLGISIGRYDQPFEHVLN
jgi:hypothetical protein